MIHLLLTSKASVGRESAVQVVEEQHLGGVRGKSWGWVECRLETQEARKRGKQSVEYERRAGLEHRLEVCGGAAPSAALYACTRVYNPLRTTTGSQWQE